MGKLSSRIEIRSVRPDSVAVEVLIDGHQIRGVRSLRLDASINQEIPVLTLDLNALDISVDMGVMKIMQGEEYEVEFNFKDELPEDSPSAD